MEELERKLIPSDLEPQEVVCIFDTSYMNFENNKGKIDLESQHIGYLNKSQGIGFGFHGCLLISGATRLPLGVGACDFLVRPQGQEQPHYKARPAHERESAKWFSGLERTRAALPLSSSLVVVCDREADVYGFINQASKLANTKLVVRVARERSVLIDGEKSSLMSLVNSMRVVGTYTLALREEPERPARETCLSVSFAAVELARPAAAQDSALDPSQPVHLVYVREVGVEDGLDWKIFTTIPVNSLEEAAKIIDHYKSRWLIEECFRVMKTKGLQVESSQIESGKALQRLTLLAFHTAQRILTLKLGRDVEEPGSISYHFSPIQQELLRLILPKVQGRRGLQLNPHPPDSLAWAAWIIARLGGWTPGNPKRPAGVMTFHRGLQRFADWVEGYRMAKGEMESQDRASPFFDIP